MEMIKDEDSFETVDISGMSGGYERACQLLLQAGKSLDADTIAFVLKKVLNRTSLSSQSS